MARWRALARFNKRATNRIAARLVGHVPTLAIVEHTGRRSGRVYRTPADAFRRPGGYAIVLTYGPDTDWVQNVLAAGEATLDLGRRRVRVVNPRVLHDPRHRLVPPLVRDVLRLLRTEHFLLLDEAGPDPATG
jgi:deazaflavin-dependent oxidoreductase (nitroreductase family)